MNIDSMAAAYRWLEYAAFGRALEHARFEFLSRATDARRVLILGEGDGRFLERFLRSNSRATVAVVESSREMIRLARARVSISDLGRVHFYQINAVSQSLPDGPFDFVVSHFFLDILQEQDAVKLICRTSDLLGPNAHWMLSEFQVPRGGIASLHARLWLRSMYGFFAATTGLRASRLPPFREMLRQQDFAEIAYKERRMGLIRSQLWRRNR